ncbi:MAG: peroxiredoxin [Candidatus Micrarchaeaceae archaeon]
MVLKEGDLAPDFKLEGTDGKTHTLRDYSGKFLVLYFYPKDDTPGCTIEAKGFSASIEEIRRRGAEVVGISKDDLKSHGKFCSKYSLKLLLLSDPSSRVIKAYDAYGDLGIFGMGTLRKTYIIDKNGKIAKIYPKVKPDGHEKEVIAFLDSMK